MGSWQIFRIQRGTMELSRGGGVQNHEDTMGLNLNALKKLRWAETWSR